MKRAEATPSRRAGGAGAPGGHLRFGVLEELVSFGLVRAKLAMYYDVGAITGMGITASQFSALVIIGANPGLNQSALSKALSIGAPAVVALLDALAEKALVRRRAVRGDRRANGLQLTPEGEEHLAAFQRDVMEADRRMAATLTTEERGRLRGLLAKLAGGTPGAGTGKA